MIVSDTHVILTLTLTNLVWLGVAESLNACYKLDNFIIDLNSILTRYYSILDTFYTYCLEMSADFCFVFAAVKIFQQLNLFTF